MPLYRAWLDRGQARLRRPKAERPRGDGLACLCGETEGSAELEELQPQLARPIVKRCGNDATRQRHRDVCIKCYGYAVVSLTTKPPFRPPNPEWRRAKPRVIATAWYPARNGNSTATCLLLQDVHRAALSLGSSAVMPAEESNRRSQLATDNDDDAADTDEWQRQEEPTEYYLYIYVNTDTMPLARQRETRHKSTDQLRHQTTKPQPNRE